MTNRNVYIVAKRFHALGCLAYLCKTPEEIRSFPKIIKKIQSPGVQLVMLNSPEIYSEYAPYTYIDDKEEFIHRVSRMRDVVSP